MNESQSLLPQDSVTKKDYLLGLLSGLLIGLLLMPILKAANSNLYAMLRLAILPIFLIGTPLGLVISHKISRKIPVIWQIAKFGVTGVLNVLVDFGTLTLIIFFFRKYFELNSKDIAISLGFAVITFYSLYKAASFIVANINSYFWNKYWTFHKEGGKQSEFIQFFIVSVVGFFVNVAVASLVFSGFSASKTLSSDQWALVGAACGSIAGLAWNFVGYKFIVFKK